MDENDFKVAFNDVDFCLKILEKGYRIVYKPDKYYNRNFTRSKVDFSIEPEEIKY